MIVFYNYNFDKVDNDCVLFVMAAVEEWLVFYCVRE